MRTMSVCLVGCAALLAAAGDVTAQDSTGAITGVVRARDTGAPVARVGVSVVGTRLAAESDAEGRYAISGVPPGTYHLRARLLGYAPGDTTVMVQAAQRAVADFRLQPSAIDGPDRRTGGRPPPVGPGGGRPPPVGPGRDAGRGNV